MMSFIVGFACGIAFSIACVACVAFFISHEDYSIGELS